VPGVHRDEYPLDPPQGGFYVRFRSAQSFEEIGFAHSDCLQDA
jgi:hypothetical protein